MASSILETLETIVSHIPTVEKETIPIESAINRIVADDYLAHFNLPRFHNSAMDGYVVKVSDAGKTVDTHEVIYAGDNPTMTLIAGNAIKIMTGAPIPHGADAVIPIENVKFDEGKIILPKEIQDNHFIRMAGEDIKKGEIYISKGEVINAYTIASLASQGMTHISVYRKVNVTVFATGDELRPHFEKIEAHQLYNSNSPMFMARAKSLNCDVRLIQTSSDTIQSLKTSIQNALGSDIIITSGGVSVGDKDFTKEAFTRLGMHTLIDKVDIKPGKPTVIGVIENTTIVNLPGNPLAAMVNFELFVRAILRKISGRLDYYHAPIHTKMKSDFSIRKGKHSVILGKFNGESFEPLKPQMPGMVSPMQKADGFILTTPDMEKLSINQTVKMIPIKWESTSMHQIEIFSQ
ncbi:MAG: molybdopterin molybdotransferase MoeA [Sulfurovum sp.]|nr:molybdopterin molybdotransferase MoeA [Sulfurovum sp.]